LAKVLLMTIVSWLLSNLKISNTLEDDNRRELLSLVDVAASSFEDYAAAFSLLAVPGSFPGEADLSPRIIYRRSQQCKTSLATIVAQQPGCASTSARARILAFHRHTYDDILLMSANSEIFPNFDASCLTKMARPVLSPREGFCTNTTHDRKSLQHLVAASATPRSICMIFASVLAVKANLRHIIVFDTVASVEQQTSRR
jgi:hypothetical protein